MKENNKSLNRSRRVKRKPCETRGTCPYEYDNNPERDIEGMPLLYGDPRSCPDYGHICPEFMEEFGLTLEDLATGAWFRMC
jgi:hypothetical protein